MRESRTRKTRTNRSRNVLPRLLTKIQDMCLLDPREPKGKITTDPIGTLEAKGPVKKRES
jgi:hypothetical protein